MAEVFVAASSEQDARARGLAEALAALGFETGWGALAETELAKLAEESKCIVALWTGEAPAAGFAVLATLALERKKLICAELRTDATPPLFQAAPRLDLRPRDRAAFKERFARLIAEIEKLTPSKAKIDALPDALIRARAALLARPQGANAGARTAMVFAAAVAALFVVGFGAGRIINAVRAGEFEVAMPRLPSWPERVTTTAAQAAPAPVAPEFGVSAADLERQSWRDAARHIDPGAAERIKAAAARGDAMGQALACLGHMAGAEGFLPSPSAAREQCDASAAQHHPAGLYLSWALRRAAPHAGIDEATARARLAEAAQLGWLSALIDYGTVLAPNTSAPLEAQAEAGRLYLAAAERGDARGQFFYARWLRDSPAGPRNPSAAIPFLQRAADQRQAEALHMLATLYRDGIGATQDATRAKALYDRAARQNHPPSMFNLADMLRAGPPPERARAVELYQALACMRDERQIQPMAVQRLRALQESAACR